MNLAYVYFEHLTVTKAWMNSNRAEQATGIKACDVGLPADLWGTYISLNNIPLIRLLSPNVEDRQTQIMQRSLIRDTA